MLRFEVIYSPDEGGYYAEIFDTETGKTVKRTRLTIGPDLTKKNAIKFIEQYNKRAKFTAELKAVQERLKTS